jgi:hypothetical protein
MSKPVDARKREMHHPAGAGLVAGDGLRLHAGGRRLRGMPLRGADRLLETGNGRLRGGGESPQPPRPRTGAGAGLPRGLALGRQRRRHGGPGGRHGHRPRPAGLAQRPRHRALPADARPRRAPPRLARAAGLLPRHRARPDGAHHRLHPRPSRDHRQPRPAGFLPPGAAARRAAADGGAENWVDYGIRHYGDHPQQQEQYFKLQLADSRAVLQRERHGTLFADAERRLDLTCARCGATRSR